MHGGKSPSRPMTATDKMRRKVQGLQKVARTVAEKNRYKKRCWVLREISSLVSEKSQVEWPSIPKELCGENGPGMEDLYLIFMSDPSHILQLGVSWFMRCALTQDLSCDNVYSNPLGPFKKQIRLSSLKMALLKACSCVLTLLSRSMPCSDCR